MRKLFLLSTLSATTMAGIQEYPGAEQAGDLPINTFKITYDSSREFTDEISDAFSDFTGEETVGAAIKMLANGSNIKKAECTPKFCEVEWTTANKGEASGSVEGHGLVGGVSGDLSGSGAKETTFKISVPCVMLYDTIQMLDNSKKKKEN